ASSPAVRSLISEASRRVLSWAVEHFDARQPERFLPADGIDELIQTECQALLEESLARPDVAEVIASFLEVDKAADSLLEDASFDLLQCGSDRRTLVFVPHEGSHEDVTEKVRSARPLAALVKAGVDDVIVVSEEAGISPQSLALGLERMYPGIADAA